MPHAPGPEVRGQHRRGGRDQDFGVRVHLLQLVCRYAARHVFTTNVDDAEADGRVTRARALRSPRSMRGITFLPPRTRATGPTVPSVCNAEYGFDVEQARDHHLTATHSARSQQVVENIHGEQNAGLIADARRARP